MGLAVTQKYTAVITCDKCSSPITNVRCAIVVFPAGSRESIIDGIYHDDCFSRPEVRDYRDGNYSYIDLSKYLVEILHNLYLVDKLENGENDITDYADALRDLDAALNFRF